MLKAVCDSNDLRTVSYLAETSLEDENGEPIPRTFDFGGSIIFITNYDFDAMIEKNHKLTPHLQALMSRSHYIDLTMKTRRDYIVRIKQVIEGGMLNQRGMDKKVERDVVDFVANWYEIADITMCWNNKR